MKPSRTRRIATPRHSLRLGNWLPIGLALALATAAVRADLAFQVLYKFFPTGSNGFRPDSPLAEKDGSFYGALGGNNQTFGRIFKFTPGSGVPYLTNFDTSPGFQPFGGLTLGSDGNLYGVTKGSRYGDPGAALGTLFRVTTNGDLTTLFDFRSTNWGNPASYLTLGSDGNLYGTTDGVIFSSTTNGVVTKLKSLSHSNPADGYALSFCQLTETSNGWFYGTALYGGTTDGGTIFKVRTNGEFATLASSNGTNGTRPLSPILGPDQNLYGVTLGGGTSSNGTIFRMSQDGALSTIASFDGANGRSPGPGLTLSADGQFYGSAAYRLINGKLEPGVLFSVSTNGLIKVLLPLDGTNGLHPYAFLSLSKDGNLYGTVSDANWEATADGSYGSIIRLVPPPTISSLTRSNHAVVLSWNSFTNGQYRLEQNTNLVSAPWTPLLPTVTADKDTTSLQVPVGDAPVCYFRVVLLP